MNRLQAELHRLFFFPSAARLLDADAAQLIDAHGMTRALVMELARPADWAVMATVWQGVQRDLDLPAPAIAVSGTEGFQLWFSLSAPVPVQRAHEFLEGLRQRYLPDIARRRVSLLPDATAAVRHARRVPSPQTQSGNGDNWSAFVAPDLAPVFADTPWLDLPPGDEGQADLLRGLVSMSLSVFETAAARLQPAVALARSAVPHAAEQTSAAAQDPRRFLLQVMNDPSVALSLRIEAAKALLPPPCPQSRY